MPTAEQWEFRIAKLDLQPGDVLVISMPAPLDNEVARRVSGMIHARKLLPADVKLFFKPDDITLSILTQRDLDNATKIAPGAFIHRRNDMSGVRGFGATQVIIDDPHKP